MTNNNYVSDFFILLFTNMDLNKKRHSGVAISSVYFRTKHITITFDSIFHNYPCRFLEDRISQEWHPNQIVESYTNR